MKRPEVSRNKEARVVIPGGRGVMITVSLTVNGESVSAETESDTLLSEFIRENLKMTGTHIGCDTSQCGACVVLVDGDSVKS